MEYSTAVIPAVTIGVDLGDKVSDVCFVDGASGDVIRRARVATTRERFLAFFGELEPARVVIECGTHSPWVSRLLDLCGHEVIVANPRKAPRKGRKNDWLDAEGLARDGRIDPQALYPIQHRGVQAQSDVALISARDGLVKSRTQLINQVRGIVKSLGYRLRGSSAAAFAAMARKETPKQLKEALGPVIGMIGELTKRIRSYDKKVEAKCNEYSETQYLQQVDGVGNVTSLAYVLMIEDPTRFEDSRNVGAYFGLVPDEHSSGESKPQLRISKQGSSLMRRLLTNSAHYILGPFGPDCDLRRFGERILARGGVGAKKRAVAAVTRKLAVLLHVLWKNQAVYEPLRNSEREPPRRNRRRKMKTGSEAVR